MQNSIHPKYEEITVKCSCGSEFKTGSSFCKDIAIEVCSKCHPFYTGNQKIIDSAGRVEKFRKRYSKSS